MEHSPYASEGSPYPLLTAWYYGRLKEAYEEAYEERVLNILHDSNSPHLQQVRELAAAQLVVELGDEYVQLEAHVKRIVQAYQDPDYTDDFIDFYDILQDLESYRQILQDLSGTRTMLLDEQDYREKRGH